MYFSKIVTDKLAYEKGEKINITVENPEEDCRIGVYGEKAEPGEHRENEPIPEYITAELDENKATLDTSALPEAGYYRIFLFKNKCDYADICYETRAMTEILIYSDDKTDYRPAEVSVSVTFPENISHTEIKVKASDSASHAYTFYWSNNGARLCDYMPVYRGDFAAGEDGTFTLTLNDGIFMPAEADEIEVTVKDGHSSSLFVKVTGELHLKESKYLYSFSVFTDIHIGNAKTIQYRHFMDALEDVARIKPDGIGICTCGDNTNTATLEQYSNIVDAVKAYEGRVPRFIWATGNHDIVYFEPETDLEHPIARFAEKLGGKQFYTVEEQGAKFIMLGTDTRHFGGTMHSPMLEWFTNELEAFGKSRPVFSFVHQAFKDTVSGSLSYKDEKIQCWYGLVDATPYLRSLFREYPNAFHFSGHGHWSLESPMPVHLGRGKDANFINAASVGYLWNDTNDSEAGSEGFYVDVYEDYVVLRGREFVLRQWCSMAQFCVPVV